MSCSSSSFTMYIPLFLILQSFLAVNMYRQRRFSKEQVCHEANATLVIVQSCPENDIIYREKSKRKMCERYPKCLGEPLVYHCVRSKENLVEVCAPNGPIVGSCCAVFDRGVGRVVEDYSTECTECPFKYQSVNCRNYSSCFKNHHFIQSYNQTTTTYSTSHHIDAGSNQTLQYHKETTSQTILIIVLATTIPAAILLGCLIVIFRCRHLIKGSKECSPKEKEYLKGINIEPLMVKGNFNSDLM